MAETKQYPDGSLAIYSESEGLDMLRLGGMKNPTPGGQGSSSSSALTSGVNYRGAQRIKLTLFNGTANITAAMGYWVNNLDGPVIVGETTLNVRIGGSTTFSISVGTGLVSSQIEFKGACNNLIDTYNYNTTETNNVVVNNIDEKGSNGKSRGYLAVGDAIGVTCNRSLLTPQIDLYVTLTKA